MVPLAFGRLFLSAEPKVCQSQLRGKLNLHAVAGQLLQQPHEQDRQQQSATSRHEKVRHLKRSSNACTLQVVIGEQMCQQNMHQAEAVAAADTYDASNLLTCADTVL